MNAPDRSRLETGLLQERYAEVRDQTARLAAPLSEEDACVQSMPDASPAKWHLAHTTWFFETFVLEPRERPFAPCDPSFRVLFNSYYNGVGDQHPRAQRGLLTRPSLTEVREYRRIVDERVRALLERDAPDAALRALVTLGLNHEQQHQELLLTDIKHLLSLNPLKPAYRAAFAPAGPARALGWRDFGGGLVQVGHEGPAFAFDNETPRHEAKLEPFALATRLVTNGEFLRFIEEGGYRQPELWLSEGWSWREENRIERPVYWFVHEGAWHEFTLSGAHPLAPAAPAVHLSYFEADAFARWAGARLPSEAEWEHAAAARPVEGNFAESGLLHPAPAPEAPGGECAQLFGDAWEWTRSSYSAYPGYRPAPGAIGEYNGKFMVNQYVLRGGSCATPRDHVRASYRNFFPTAARWQFTGIRLARDA
jgi:ergothioneine biosynthesis protein EgtB